MPRSFLEGYVDLAESRLEGPFGDHTGYYSLTGEYPVFHVKCITGEKCSLSHHHRRTAAAGGLLSALATERIFLPC